MGKIFHSILIIFVVACLAALGWGIEWLRWSMFCNVTHTHIGFWTWVLINWR